MLTVWDDHDFGMNDAGGDYQYKEASEALFEYVWNVKDERAERHGVYGSWVLGRRWPPGTDYHARQPGFSDRH